jgi:hypothetical protein
MIGTVRVDCFTETIALQELDEDGTVRARIWLTHEEALQLADWLKKNPALGGV